MATSKLATKDVEIKTVEMHTGGMPLRIVVSGYPKCEGDTILEKIRYAKKNLDHLRKLLMLEPRGHYDMYGAVLVDPGPNERPVDLAVMFTHNEGYSTMCGHGVIALGRFAIDKGYVQPQAPETLVSLQCPCGPVKAFVQYDAETKKTGDVKFHSVPAFALELGSEVNVEGRGNVRVDLVYGGAFYAFISAEVLGLDVRTSRIRDIVTAATAVANAVKAQKAVKHPENKTGDLDFLYGVIVTDGRDEWSNEPTANICVFADAEADRSPCGSGVTARIALQHTRGQIALQQTRTFESGITGALFTGKPITETKCGSLDAVIVEVGGRAYYTGEATYTIEKDDQVGRGFLLR